MPLDTFSVVNTSHNVSRGTGSFSPLSRINRGAHDHNIVNTGTYDYNIFNTDTGATSYTLTNAIKL